MQWIPLLNQTPQAQTLAQNPSVLLVQSSKLLSVADPRHLFSICKPTELQANHVRGFLSPRPRPRVVTLGEVAGSAALVSVRTQPE